MGEERETVFVSAALSAAVAGRLEGRRQWVHLLTPGVVQARDGRAFVLDDPAAVVKASLSRTGTTDIAVDYEHQIDFAKVNGKPAPAAGWIKQLDVRDSGIWGLVEWTEAAAAMIGRKEYRYLSPVIGLTKDLHIVAILRVALTNNPALDLVALASAEDGLSSEGAGKAEDGRLVPRAAEARAIPRTPTHFLQTTFNDEGRGAGERDDAFDRLTALASERSTARERSAPMPVSPAILAALDLPADADEQAVLDAIDALRVRAEDAAAPAALGAMTALMTELGADRRKFRSERVAAKIETAMRDGVIVPAMKEWATALCMSDEAAFDGFVANVGAPFASLFKPVVTPEMEAKLSAELAADGRGDHRATPGLKGQIARQLGIDTKALD